MADNHLVAAHLLEQSEARQDEAASVLHRAAALNREAQQREHVSAAQLTLARVYRDEAEVDLSSAVRFRHEAKRLLRVAIVALIAALVLAATACVIAI